MPALHASPTIRRFGSQRSPEVGQTLWSTTAMIVSSYPRAPDRFCASCLCAFGLFGLQLRVDRLWLYVREASPSNQSRLRAHRTMLVRPRCRSEYKRREFTRKRMLRSKQNRRA